MNKIISTIQAFKISKKLHQTNKQIVLAGGCFDILHIGHIEFLKKAKQKGDSLFILVESDETIKKMKGPKRPINRHLDRAKILAALQLVDYIIMLPPFMKDYDYDSLIIKLKPDIIATTKGDPNRLHKKRQATLVNGKLVDVTTQIKNHSTTRLISLLEKVYE